MWHSEQMGAHRKVSDEQIAAAVASLFGRDGSAWPTVMEVADRLRRDHGHQGTHERIRAVLARSKDAEQENGGENSEWRKRALELEDEFAGWRREASARIEELERELISMRERAELAESREDSSTRRWMMEVDELRQALQGADARRPKGVPHEQYLELYQLHQMALRELEVLRRGVGVVKAGDRDSAEKGEH